MADADAMQRVQAEFQEGMSLPKCRKCGCMKIALEKLQPVVCQLPREDSRDLQELLATWLVRMDPIKYECLGCEHCFPAVALNAFQEGHPEAVSSGTLSCGFESKDDSWPPVVGEFYVFDESSIGPVAISTLASVELAASLARNRPEELCIVGKTETENIGIDKLIKNTVTNPHIRYLIVAGKDPKGHFSGKTLLALHANGVDENMKVIGSPGKQPVLRNVSRSEIELFRNYVQTEDMIGCEDMERIIQKVKMLSRTTNSACRCEESPEARNDIRIEEAPTIRASGPEKIEMDTAGYFVIFPRPEKGLILVEHYSYDNKLQRTIEGKDARILYWTIINNGWVSQLSHAAYLGKELAKAELSMKHGFEYIQDGA